MFATRSLAAAALAMSMQATADDAARDYLRFTSINAADCVMLQGKMRQLVNTHDSRAIEAYIYRYMGETQQPGRRVEAVPPGKQPINLGCTHVTGGGTQRWQITKAQFLD